MSSPGVVPCIVCDEPLAHAYLPTVNQPSGGTSFSTSGHYGSGAFDPMDGTTLELNVCDRCLRAKAASVLHYPRPVRPDPPTVRPTTFADIRSRYAEEDDDD